MTKPRNDDRQTPGVEVDLDNREFQNAWNLIAHTNQSVFLTGKAGTGKSTFLRYVTANTDKSYVVLAPTGIAAVNVGGQTLHSFFKLPLKPLLPDDVEFAPNRLQKRMKYSAKFVKLLKGLDLIIIDEISMVRADIVDFVDKLLRHYCRNPREPFAGKQLLLVGDLFQLEPVVTPDMKLLLHRYYPNAYFFSANAFKQIPLVSVELTKVYRQTQEDFISLLDRVRMGIPTADDITRINSRISNEAPAETRRRKEMVMTLATRRDTVEAINDARLKEIRRPMRTYEGVITGEFPDNNLPTPRTLQLKEGAQIVFVKNDYDRRWVNGTVGKVTKCLPERIEVTLENGTTHEVEQDRWANIVYEYDEKRKSVIEKEIGAYVQYPVKLAWALTIHKSQGLTFNNLIIDMGSGAFSSGQTYVALSRCRSLDGLRLLSPLGAKDIFVNRAISEFSRTFNDETMLHNALRRGRRRDNLKAASKLWEQCEYTLAYDKIKEVFTDEPALLANPLLNRFIRSKILRQQKETQDTINALNEQLGEREALLATLSDEYVELGYYCLEDGQELTPAIANFDKALRLTPDNVRAMIGRALVLIEQREFHDAMDTLLKAQSIVSRQDKGSLDIIERAIDEINRKLEQD